MKLFHNPSPQLVEPLYDLDICEVVLNQFVYYVHKKESIEANFLSCFVSLLILRLLERKTGCSIPIGTMVESLRKANLVEHSDSVYKSAYCDNVIFDIGTTLDLDPSKNNIHWET